MGGCRSGVCWKARSVCARRLSGHRPPCQLHRDDARRSGCGIAKPPRCSSRQGAAARRAQGSPTPNLARTLQSIADEGWHGFYEGPVAAEMARFSEENGGLFALADFGRQRAIWGEPLVGRYRDVTVYNTPPPTQGFTVLEMLNLVEPHRTAPKGFSRARPCPSAGAGQADRLSRPRSACWPIPRLPMCRSSG